MPVQATCTECNKRIQASDKFAGRSVDCPNCRSLVAFPELPTTAGRRPTPSTRPLPSRLVACPDCGAEHRLLRAEAQQVRCRDCRRQFVVAAGELYPFGVMPATSYSGDSAGSTVAMSGVLPDPGSSAASPPSAAASSSLFESSSDSGVAVVASTTDSASGSQVGEGLTALTPASVVPPVESAPVAEVKSPSDIHPVESTPIEVRVDSGPGSIVPVVTHDAVGSGTTPSVNVTPVIQVDVAASGGGAAPIQVGAASDGAAPIEVGVDPPHGGPPVIANAGALGGGAYAPVLRQLGPKKSMVGRAVEKDLKNRGSRLKASVRCKIGPDKSFRERIQQLGMFPEEVEMQVDDLMVLTIGDREGDFRVVMPFDKGVACPVEFISVMPGRLPTSMGLLRGRGGNWGLAVSNTKPGSLLPQQVQAVMSAFGGQADAVWAVLDPSEPQMAAEVLQQDRSLQNDLRFASKVKLGPMEVTYHINWIAQAMPLGPDQYLLVAKFIPRNRMMSLNFGAEWFVTWRDQFHRAIGQLPPGQGNFYCFDYGFIWGAVAQEMMGLKLL